MMEPKRPKMDAAVLKLFTTQSLSGVVIRSDGQCRLSPQLPRGHSGRFEQIVGFSAPVRMIDVKSDRLWHLCTSGPLTLVTP
jgi:hypothetical protein